MLDQINKQLDIIKNELAKKHVLEKKLEELKKDLSISEGVLYQLEQELKKEKRDVDNLKKLSLSNIVSTVMGNKDEKIQKEEQEYIMAKIKYDNCQSKVHLITSDMINVKERLKSLSDYEDEYKDLLKKKIEIINKYGDEKTKSKIMQMEENIDSYLKEITEIEESLFVGNRLISEIYQAKKLLESAKTWSTFDLFGGDMISSMAKHSKIDEAQNHFSKIYSLTNSFNKELGDVNLSGVSFSSATKTFDIFFDNIFSDLSVDSHIRESYDSVCSLESSVENTLRTLRMNKQKLNVAANDKRREYEEFVKSI